MAVKQHQAHDLDEAEVSYRDVISADPTHVAALHNLALLRHRMGRSDEAIDILRRALAVDSADASCWNSLGNVLSESGRAREAITAYREAVRHAPQHVNALCNLGLALRDTGDLSGAVICYRRALELSGADAELWDRLGEVLALDRQLAAANQAFRKALEIDPRRASAYNNLGLAYVDQGDLSTAVEYFRMALKLAPSMAQALSNLARAKKFTPDDAAEIASFETALESAALDETDRMRVHFALGKVHEDCGCHDASFAHYRRGNELASRTRSYDAARHAAFVSDVRRIYTRDFFARTRGYGFASELPIFIIGMPRSGTTLVEQILASHPQVFGAGELSWILGLAGRLAPALQVGLPYPQCAERLRADVAARLGSEYVERLRDTHDTARRVTDKQPTNFLHLGLICALLPGARIVHCRRDARDVCLSNYFQLYGNEAQHFSYRLRDLARYHANYRRLMRHWQEHLPVPIHEVRYEELVADPESVSRALIAYAGLDWDVQCLGFHRTRRDVQTASHWQVRQPIYQSSAGRWKHFEPYLQELIKELDLNEACEIDT